ncbi:formate transporter (plasmid) [Fulvitalea axinellae]|uniref:Formate transporter n=1 Tax=Fulvitalea axinellae TaxID=1182444 RepID=A0AAU9CY63_9BACT|nr:formate transporter [Fulvitalea axinellae]
MGYLSPSEIGAAFIKSAKQKLKCSSFELFLLAIMGGAFVALGGLLSIVVGGGMPEVAANNPGLQKFIFGSVFPVGLIMVILSGADLFTSDCAIMTVTTLSKESKWAQLCRVWTVSYIGNFVGAILVAFLFAYKSGVITQEPFAQTAIDIAVGKTSNPFIKTFVKGIGANWLVCTAVWMAYSAKDNFGRIIGIWLPVMTFVTFGFEHSIANMFFIPTAVYLGADISWGTFITANLIPATLGNIVGGALFVGGYNWFLFVRGKEAKQGGNTNQSLISDRI